MRRERRGRRRAVRLCFVIAVLACAGLAGCSDAHLSVNQPMLKKVYARLNEERTFMSELGPKSADRGSVELAECYKTDSVTQQPSLERGWEVPGGQAADAVRALQAQAQARGWRDDSAGSEIVRLRKQAHGDSLVLEIISESDGAGTSNLHLDLYVDDLKPCS